MHSFYLDFLKSLKAYVSRVFPDIEHYQFNYADYAFLNYKLYEDHVKEFPMCMINLQDITSEDNQAFKRFVGNKHSSETAQLLANNHTKKDSVVMDFKWVTLQVQIKINLGSVADLLDYHNLLISEFPKNFMFYSYKYNALINIDNVTKSWDVSDTTEGLVYRTTSQIIEAFASYSIEPIFRINNITKNKIINSDNSIDISLEIKLKVPNKIGNITMDDRIVDGIQIVVAGAGGAEETLPILIDMNNDIFSDRQHKLSRSYILTKEMFNIEESVLDLPISFSHYSGLSVAVYMVDDSTANKPQIIFIEVPILSEVSIIQEYLPAQEYIPYSAAIDDIPEQLEVLASDEQQEIQAIRIILEDLTDFRFSELTNLQLLIFT